MNPFLTHEPYREYNCSDTPVAEHTDPDAHSTDMCYADKISCKRHSAKPHSES